LITEAGERFASSDAIDVPPAPTSLWLPSGDGSAAAALTSCAFGVSIIFRISVRLTEEWRSFFAPAEDGLA
jgi:hypothetical protein